MAGNNTYVLLLFIILQNLVFGQIIEGKIIFERKTNLEKKFTDRRMSEMIKDNKIKVENFEMYFNETNCVFKPVESMEADPLSWATTRNTVYQNLETKERVSILDLWGNKVFVKDSTSGKQWKVTDSHRNIAGFDCRKAIWEKDDSTRIYAWFSIDIVPSIGPEMFTGLPGAILGLATEDGGIIYFAKEVKITDVAPEQFTYKLGKDVYTVDGLKTELTKRFANEPWGQRAIVDLFRWF
jgi:GLPGLI family protein